MSDERPPRDGGLPRPKGRLPFEERPFDGAVKHGALWLYGVLVLGLLGVALYMALVEGHALTSAYVAGPGIGVLWFGLRLFMIWGSRT